MKDDARPDDPKCTLHNAPGTRGAASSRGDHLAPSTHVDDDDESAATEDEESEDEMNMRDTLPARALKRKSACVSRTFLSGWRRRPACEREVTTLAPRYTLRLCRWWLDRALHQHLMLAARQLDDASLFERIEIVPHLSSETQPDTVRRMLTFIWAEHGLYPGGGRFIDAERIASAYARDGEERSVVLGALNGLLTDLGVLSSMMKHEPSSSASIIDSFLDVGTLGAESVTAAAKLVSPAIVWAERANRRRDVGRVAFIED